MRLLVPTCRLQFAVDYQLDESFYHGASVFTRHVTRHCHKAFRFGPLFLRADAVDALTSLLKLKLQRLYLLSRSRLPEHPGSGSCGQTRHSITNCTATAPAAPASITITTECSSKVYNAASSIISPYRIIRSGAIPDVIAHYVAAHRLWWAQLQVQASRLASKHAPPHLLSNTAKRTSLILSSRLSVQPKGNAAQKYMFRSHLSEYDQGRGQLCDRSAHYLARA